MKFKKTAAGLTALALSVTALATPLSENFSGILDGLFDKISYSAVAETYGDYEYTAFDDGTVHIIKYNGTDESITIPSEIDGKTVIAIGESAFKDCVSLAEVTIPDSVASIGNMAFYNCSGLNSITLPSELKIIGGWAFQNCTGLTSMTIPETVTSIGSSAFQNCSLIESINIPDGITIIENYQFSGCSSLKSITIPDSVVEIGHNSFCDCSGLTEIIIPESVQSIRNRAFFGCSGLEAVTVPKNLTDLANDVFSNCSGLTSINVSAENSKYSSEDGALYDKNKATLICCPAGKTSITFPGSVATIGEYAFYGCSKLTSLTIPDTVLTIGNYVFWNCSELESIAIPDSVTSIGNYVFYGCTGLKSVTFPESIEKIGDNVFAYCTGLESVIIPDSVTSIGNSAFWSCTSLESITIPDGVISIGNAAFCGDTNLTSITIPDSVTTFGFGVFDGCSNLTIKCNSGSAAYQYAVANNINYTLLDANPANVTGLKMTANNANSISMSWTKVSDATGYVVYQAINGKWEKIKVTNGNTITVSSLSAGTDYKFTVKAYKTVDETNYYSLGYTGVWMTTAPANVTGLKMTANTPNSISMSWTKVPNATGYVVYQAVDGKWQKIKVTSSNTLTVSNLKAGTNYRFTVKAYKTVSGTNYYSPSYTGVWMTTLPAKPAAKMTVNTPQAIRLEWGKVTGATGYVVYQQVNGSWVKKAVTTNNVYVATGLKSGTNYNFAVRAYRTFNGKNYYSPFATATDTIKTCTKPATVNFTLTAGTKKATVNWGKVTGATGYIVYYKTSASGSWQKLTTTTGTSFTKTGLTSGKTYYFTVKAYKTFNGATYNASFTTKSVKVK